LQVINEEPVSPRQLQSKTPRDLETVCLKCLRKDPTQRYPTALGLADDLRRWLNGEPVRARPVGGVERVWRWCRRNPVVAGLTALVLLAFALGFDGVTWQWRIARDKAAAEKQARSHAEEMQRKASAAQEDTARKAEEL